MIEGTYETLISIERDITTQSKLSPAFAFFMAEKIKRFKDRNRLRLDIANRQLTNIFEKYINKNEDGTWKQVKEDGKPARWDFKSEEAEKSYNKEYSDLMSITIDIHS